MNLALITLLLTGAFAIEPTCDKATESLVEFRIKNAGIEVTGVVEDVSVDINFLEKNLKGSTIVARAKATSIKTGITIRDKHLQRSDYFHTELYPYITLRSTSFQKIAGHEYFGTFILTIKNIKKEISIPFSVQCGRNGITYSAAFEINRLDFGLGEESLILDDTVRVFVTGRIQK